MPDNSNSAVSYKNIMNWGAPYCPYSHNPADKVVIFLDVRNITTTLRELHLDNDFDFRKLLMDNIDGRNLVAAIAVDGKHESLDYATRFQCRLRESGFRLDLVSVTNSFGKQEGTDVQLALLAQRYAIKHMCDHIVLITGDGDFSVLVDSLHDEGMVVEVVSFKDNLSGSLRRKADEVRTIDQMPLVRMRPVDLEEVRS